MAGPQQDSSSSPAEYFQELDYTPEQKAQIDKIHRDAETRRAAVAKDEELDQDQKDAMLAGYTHLEYGSIFKVLTPEQQRQVREKVRARKAAEQAAQKKQPPQR
jgi:Spy/CpxP family protein refolding chaperone